jgi:hypothetical protein
MSSSRVCTFLLTAALALAATSCGSGGGPPLHPAAGKMTLNGQPAAGATVVFMPANSGPTPSGVVGDDGRYELSTHPHGKGAPAGEYTVVVTKFPPDAREQGNPKNLYPAKYADPATSGLKRTVAASGGDLDPIDLSGEPDKPRKSGK